MTKVGERERTTEQSVAKLFTATLGYDYLGDWTDRVGNRNMMNEFLPQRRLPRDELNPSPLSGETWNY